MAADNTQTDFFAKKSGEEETPDPEANAPETIKLGEKEFDQETLNELVGLAEKVKTFEEKNNQSFDDYISNTGRIANEKGELERKLKELESQQLTQRADSDWDSMTQEERDQLAKQELDRLGVPYGEKLDQYIEQKIEARDFVLDVQDFIDAQVDEGKPRATVEEILREASKVDEYANADSYEKIDYEKIYRNMFPSQIEAWENNRVKEQKPEGFVTDESPGGAKSPEPVRVTKDNLGDLLRQALPDS